LLAKNLPGHDIGVMLHAGYDDLVAMSDIGASPGLRDEVDALGGPTNENDLPWIRGIQESLHRYARLFVVFGGQLGKHVHAAMDIGILRRVIADYGIDDRLGLLRGGRVIQINERLAMDLAREDRSEEHTSELPS